MIDRRVLYTAAFLRALATGMIGVLLGVHLARLRFDPARIGYVIAAGLAGAALAALLVTLAGDRFGRRRSLITIALLSGIGGLGLALSSDPLVTGLVCFLGMVNGMGRDRGASLILDQVILPATTPDAQRTRVFAWYNVVQDSGGALGGLLAGLPALLRRFGAVGDVASLRLTIGVYALLLLTTAVLYLRLSAAVEVGPRRQETASGPPAPPGAPDRPAAPAPVRVSPATRRVLWRIASLFALDSLAGGFLTTALLSFFFYERFGVGEEALGPLFFLARVANALSHLGAAWLARRIGLVNTMVFTHIPSSLLLVTVAYAPSFAVAAVLFVLREGLVEMDVPTRQSYVMAVVKPEERTVASGVTHLVRVGAWAVAPSFAGLFMQGVSLMTPLVLGAGMKIVYDVLLYAACRRTLPPEERRAAGPAVS
ncbi:MAG TPA: MFS transporter [Candidatus Polarisedimenticolia bacterium]|nr:MFS transporter [Candidatus Polarisedimenticolia bacterium]